MNEHNVMYVYWPCSSISFSLHVQSNFLIPRGGGQEISFFLNDKQWILDLEKYILPPSPFPNLSMLCFLCLAAMMTKIACNLSTIFC